MSTSFTKVRLFFHKVFFVINTLFLHLCDMLYAGCVIHFNEFW